MPETQEEEEEFQQQKAMDDYVDTMAEQSEQPVYSQPQIAKEHLKVSSKISDKEPISIPIRTDGKGKVLEYRIEWRPKYKELLTNDIAKAFLNDGEKRVAKQIESCCISIKAFADSNKFKLKGIYDSFADYHSAILNTSRAHKGKSAYLSQTMYNESSVKREYSGKPKKGLSKRFG